jgi:hypothetical protein
MVKVHGSEVKPTSTINTRVRLLVALNTLLNDLLSSSSLRHKSISLLLWLSPIKLSSINSGTWLAPRSEGSLLLVKVGSILLFSALDTSLHTHTNVLQTST